MHCVSISYLVVLECVLILQDFAYTIMTLGYVTLVYEPDFFERELGGLHACLLQVLDRCPVSSDRDLELLATVLLHGELE